MTAMPMRERWIITAADRKSRMPLRLVREMAVRRSQTMDKNTFIMPCVWIMGMYCGWLERQAVFGR